MKKLLTVTLLSAAVAFSPVVAWGHYAGYGHRHYKHRHHHCHGHNCHTHPHHMTHHR